MSGRRRGQNDNHGAETNFRAVWQVAVVGGDGRTQTGAYTLQVRFTAAGEGDNYGNRVEQATRVAVNTDTAGRATRIISGWTLRQQER